MCNKSNDLINVSKFLVVCNVFYKESPSKENSGGGERLERYKKNK